MCLDAEVDVAGLRVAYWTATLRLPTELPHFWVGVCISTVVLQAWSPNASVHDG